MKEIPVSQLLLNPVDKIGREWMLCTAGGEGSYNTMTCSWGHLGCLWNLPTAICYVRPQRYTKEFVDREELYTLCFFDGRKKELGYLGTHSGREEDKVAAVGLTPAFGDGYTYFEEAKLVLVCKKLYAQDLAGSFVTDAGPIDKFYGKAGNWHRMYIGQVVAAYANQ